MVSPPSGFVTTTAREKLWQAALGCDSYLAADLVCAVLEDADCGDDTLARRDVAEVPTKHLVTHLHRRKADIVRFLNGFPRALGILAGARSRLVVPRPAGGAGR
ncbi:hypothetical protein [Streptomyces sp. NPDC003717]|uniref:hypothetical protein n=1 Tax=Streptomyces sp. NPDC003717 TaxID=3154276 RepID=UPI0033BBC58F